MRLFHSIRLLILLLILLSGQLKGQQATAAFQFLNTEDGLPQNHVFHIMQDTDGFIWFSTMGGLSRYDGFTFNNYYHKEGDSTTLSSSYINAFYQDRSGRCWVVTQSGFNYWDRRTGKARRYEHDQNNINSLGHNLTRAIIEDQDGFLWIAHQKGLDRFDPSTNQFKHYFNEQYGVARHSGALAISRSGEVWAVGVNGLFKIDRRLDSLLFVKKLPPSFSTPPHEGRDLLIDQEDRIWMGYKNGFVQYFPATNTYEVFNADPFAKGVMKILELDRNTLAIATTRGGLVFWDIATKKIIANYVHSPFDELSIRGLSIYTMYIDKVKNIWLGLFYGISVTNLETERFRFIRHEEGFANYANFILRVYQDAKGGIWSNTMNGLYYQPDVNTRAEEFIKPPYFLSGYKSIIGLAGDSKGNVFLGYKEVGLFQYSNEDGRLIQLDNGTKINVSDLLYVHSDLLHENYLWICTSDGLCRWDHETNDTTYFRPASLNKSLSSDAVNRVTQDASGNLYFISAGSICRLNYSTEILDTLPCSFRIEGNVQGLGIGQHIFWIGTKEAVFRYDLTTSQCRKINKRNGADLNSDGLTVDVHGIAWSAAGRQVSRITEDSIWQFNSPTGFVYGIGSKAADGRVLFGGDNGVIVIDPEAFYVDTAHPKIVFCGIDVANKKRQLLQEPEYVHEIELHHTEEVFTLHYAPLHFIHWHGITFRYQLVGFDKDWIEAGTSRSVTYTNLPPGQYIFKAIAMTEDLRISREPLEVIITIKPPFYRTGYFYGLLALLAGGILYVVYVQRRKTSTLKREKVLAEQQAAYKSMFLANMSHEIRTPMNAIMGLNNLLRQTPLTDKQAEYTKAISASCDNLLWIVNDILDQSKIESGTYAIETKPFELASILHQLEILFKHLAEEKNLALTFSQPDDIPAIVSGDPVRLVQVLSNLLNNAIKFTDKGSIRLVTTIQKRDEQNLECTFTITDTGIGIPADKGSMIFESFQQINEKVIAGNQGTGLGLSIVKHLVDKMGGTIQLHSKHGIGSEFVVTLPFQQHSGVDERVTDIRPSAYLKPGLRILLVEDAPLNQLVATELIKKWLVDPVVDLAENGEEAIQKVQQYEYDIILMDVKMPVMDGLEATRRIRNLKDSFYKTIPIAGLTANVIPQQIEECLQAGMDGFIAKPIRQEDFMRTITDIIPS